MPFSKTDVTKISDFVLRQLFWASNCDVKGDRNLSASVYIKENFLSCAQKVFYHTYDLSTITVTSRHSLYLFEIIMPVQAVNTPV